VGFRGTKLNPDSRFLSVTREIEPGEEISPATQLFEDHSKTILSTNDSPDIGFSVGLNPYRGCEHGCVYCYARPTHEFLDLSAGTDFESKIFVKYNAAKLLRTEFCHPGYDPKTITMSGVTDPYQPIERNLKITRQCLSVFREFNHPVAIITKNFLVTRDVDLLGSLAAQNLAAACITITTLDEDLRSKLEPRTSTAGRRLDAVRILHENGIPVHVMIAPVIPGLTDHEIPSILDAAALAGARSATYILLRLPYVTKDLFQNWLAENFPDRKEKILSRIKDVRGGALNDPRFHSRGRGEGKYAAHISNLFRVSARKIGISQPLPDLRTDLFTRAQPTLF